MYFNQKNKCFFEDLENFDKIIDFFAFLDTNTIHTEEVIQNVRNYKKKWYKIIKKFEKTFKDSSYRQLKKEFEDKSDHIVIINYTMTSGVKGNNYNQ